MFTQCQCTFHKTDTQFTFPKICWLDVLVLVGVQNSTNVKYGRMSQCLKALSVFAHFWIIVFSGFWRWNIAFGEWQHHLVKVNFSEMGLRPKTRSVKDTCSNRATDPGHCRICAQLNIETFNSDQHPCGTKYGNHFWARFQFLLRCRFFFFGREIFSVLGRRRRRRRRSTQCHVKQFSLVLETRLMKLFCKKCLSSYFWVCNKFNANIFRNK